ncbi:glycosyltransferase [Brachybacterium sp. J153]|uniref:glycosyltransferase n=1 Tax=Brachybacterium sp. J153 TaxID=3116488 RepID=UPI002E75BAB2|nr:glycosyltransferase [Brachybacterium sp. J153]MEE1617833.1 glycosyltransferase [Brachybacterium sp. J153]
MRWFARPKLEQPPMGPLVEARFFDVPDVLFRDHAGGLLGYVLETASDEYEIPTRYGPVNLGVLRGSWRELYRRVKAHNKLIGPRSKGAWDALEEERWRGALQNVVPGGEAPLVSVVMPTWNRSGTVAGAVRSIQAQGHPNWELLVADDGSSDSTRSVIRALAMGDSRIRLLELPHAGVSAARNAGLDAARGEYVAFLDSDNAWQPDFLELMVQGLESSGASAGYAGLQLHDGGKTTYRAFAGGLDHLMVINHVDLNILMVRRELAVEVRFDEGLRRWVDHDFAIRVAKRTELVLFPFIGCIYDDDRESASRITTTESDAWQWAVLGKNIVEWQDSGCSSLVPGRVSVVIPIYQDWKLTLRATQAVLEHSGDVDVEVLLIDNGSAIQHGAVLVQFFAGEPRVKYQRLPRNMNFAIGSNVGAAAGTGEYVCFLNNDTEVRDGWLTPLLERLHDPEVRGVQPLLQYDDDSIQTAGTVFLAPRTPPSHFLSGLPPEDAADVGGFRFNSVTAACLLMRRAEVADLEGFDPIFVNGMEDIDLCLRAIERFGGYFAVEPRSRVTHHESKTPGRGKKIPENRKFLMERWAGKLPAVDSAKYSEVGFKVEGVGGDKLWLAQPRPIVVRDRSAGQDRWGLRISSIGGSRGDRWGDTFYATSLASALERKGKKALSYRHGANTETERSYDDVNLVIRGLDKVYPIPDQVNVLWVISHPEDVTVEEIRAFDLVYASSDPWARQMSEKAGVEVRVLHQATDSAIFHPATEGEVLDHRPVTFVGAHFPQRVRQVVADALTSGVDMRVIGHGWRNLPPSIHEAERVANRDLGDVYRGASHVLADHWPDMAEMGFIQNRIFDAVACGTPVITDRVEGIDEVFGSLVQVYEDVDHLRFLASDGGAATFGSVEERRAQAEEVLRLHSFDARAETLIADVAERRRELFGQ